MKKIHCYVGPGTTGNRQGSKEASRRMMPCSVHTQRRPPHTTTTTATNNNVNTFYLMAPFLVLKVGLHQVQKQSINNKH